MSQDFYFSCWLLQLASKANHRHKCNKKDQGECSRHQLLPFGQCVACPVAERPVPNVKPLVGSSAVQRPVLLIVISLQRSAGAMAAPAH